MMIDRAPFGKHITKDFCRSNGKLKISIEPDGNYIDIDSVEDIVDIVKKLGCAVSVCEDGELWIDK